MPNEIKYRYLGIEDINSIIKCINISYNNMCNKNFFVVPTTKYIIDILTFIGKSIGAFYDNEMIGMASFVCSNKAKTPLYQYQELCQNQEQLIQFEHGVVIPNFQGNNIMKNLLCLACNDFSKSGYKYIISSVHPLNYPSLKTAFNIRQKAVNIVTLYNNDIRYIMIGEIQKKSYEKFQKIRYLSSMDYKAIKALLKNGYYVLDIDCLRQKIMLGKSQ